ncbi:MAG: hypothetical protein EOR84_11365 [Mesorhizobium sp.]|uniref:Imm26 family immunity protein n=1 Tax=Mesorhizobium sp. TaxID=1871066 RepID=UPI000FE868CD|nr:MAG: hypothetical protein EOR84_11365 [Mesorhizobium sp.]
MKRLNYQEGTWFLVPLRSGGYAVGLVGRMAPKGRIILAYFFGPRLDSVPTLDEIRGFQPKDSVRCLRVGDLGLVNGDWRILGRSPDWDGSHWPVPQFVRRDELSKRSWLVTYSDLDPSVVEKEEPFRSDQVLERDALYGYGAVELLLTKVIETR